MFFYTKPVRELLQLLRLFRKGIPTMKKLLSVAAGLMLSSSAFAQGLFPSVVPDLDLNQFLGRWYQVASTNPAFQADCVCVTADYSLIDANTVKVVNSCRKGSPEGELDLVEGSAKTTRNPAKLNVSFGGFSLPFSNYWVVDIAEDYRYAVVSTPFRNPIWILSRTPEIASGDLNTIYSNLQKGGFSIRGLASTLQASCTYEPFE
jgi:apolipoprotein D and lipocalin family protein